MSSSAIVIQFKDQISIIGLFRPIPFNLKCFDQVTSILLSIYIFILMFQIWDSVDSRHNSLTRIGLYKALALIALAQQGKAVNTKLLDSYSDQGLLELLISIDQLINFTITSFNIITL